jgi:hypothetical protein
VWGVKPDGTDGFGRRTTRRLRASGYSDRQASYGLDFKTLSFSDSLSFTIDASIIFEYVLGCALLIDKDLVSSAGFCQNSTGADRTEKWKGGNL